MSEIVRFKSEEYGDLLVEVDDGLRGFERVSADEEFSDRVVDAAQSFEGAVDSVIEHAKQVLDSLKKLQPDGAEIEFGIKLTAEAGVLAKVGGEANFNVKLSWDPGK